MQLTDGNMISSRRPGQGAAYVTIATTDTLACTQAYLWTPQANTWNPAAPNYNYGAPGTPNYPGQYNGGCDFFGVGCGGTGPNGGA